MKKIVFYNSFTREEDRIYLISYIDDYEWDQISRKSCCNFYMINRAEIRWIIGNYNVECPEWESYTGKNELEHNV